MSFLDEDNIAGLIAILTGMVLFKTMSYFDRFETFLRDYKIWVIVAIFLIYFNRMKISKKFGGK